MLAFRSADCRYPFFWEDATQPAARWHGAGEGPVQYLADTSHGAWAEFLRHEEITDPADVAGISRSIWVIEIGEPDLDVPDVPTRTLRGGRASYAACQAEARRLRGQGSTAISAPTAAFAPRGARGHRVDNGLHDGPALDGVTIALFGRRPDLTGWLVVADGRPAVELLDRVRHFVR